MLQRLSRGAIMRAEHFMCYMHLSTVKTLYSCGGFNRSKAVALMVLLFNNWASSWDYGTYHIGDQRKLRRACTYAQSHQSLRCARTWSMEADEGSDRKIKDLPPLDGCACAFEEWVYEFTEDEKCHNLMSWLNFFYHFVVFTTRSFVLSLALFPLFSCLFQSCLA